MSEEYIKKSDAIAGFESWKSEKNSAEENFFLCGAKEVIQSIPAADVEPVVHGEWVVTHPKILPRCSICGKPNYVQAPARLRQLQYPPRCPYCGAHMDERSDEK